MTLQIPIHHKKYGTNTMLIDKEDYDKIKDLNLTLNYTSNPNTYYGQSRVYKLEKILDESEILPSGRTRKKVYKYDKSIHIHRLVMGLDDYKKDKRIIHHKDGNGLNNCKENLIICDAMYNSQGFRKLNFEYKNYYFENDPKRKCKWRAYIKLNGKSKSKRLETEEECIKWIDNEKKIILNIYEV